MHWRSGTRIESLNTLCHFQTYFVEISFILPKLAEKIGGSIYKNQHHLQVYLIECKVPHKITIAGVFL